MEVEDIPAGALEEIASVLTITDHATGAPVPWVPNSEQKKMWRAGQEHRFVYALKPRQIGISTSQLLKDLIFTVHNAQRGVPVNTWIVWDTDAKARDKQETIMDFCRQLRFEFIKRDNQLLFPTNQLSSNFLKLFVGIIFVILEIRKLRYLHFPHLL